MCLCRNMTSVLKVFFIIMFCGSVLSDGEKIVDPCEVKDIECIKKSSTQFAQQTYRGIPEYDIKTTDPLIIPSLNYTVPDLGLAYYFKNLNITGLKTQRLTDVNMDTTTQSVQLTTQADVNIVGDVTIEMAKKSKIFPGTYTAEAIAAGSAAYFYEITKDSQGIEHFSVGPETTSCQIVSVLKHAINSEQDLENDPNILQSYNLRKAEIRRNIFCKIIKEAYHTVVHNIRASAKALPKGAFFKDI